MQIEINSEAWHSLIDEIAATYANGDLISHAWLKKKFGLAELTLQDFDNNINDFVKGLQVQQFSYMTLVDTLKKQLLEERQVCIRNVFGDGYVVIPPTDQVRYGYDEFCKDVKKAIKNAALIINNTRMVTPEQQFKDNDLKAKFGIYSQMLQNIKR